MVMRRSARLVAWPACLLLAGVALAKGTRPLDVTDLGAPVFQVYGPEDGLSDEIWSTVGIDREGFVWAGSASGLARFDGYRFTPYELPGARSLVREMETAPDGSLWAIFEREGLARYEEATRSWSLSGHRRFAHRFAADVAASGERTLYVSQEYTAMRYGPKGWEPLEEHGEPLPGHTMGLAHTDTLFGEPRLWSARHDGSLWFRRRDQPQATWQRFKVAALTHAQYTDLVRTFDQGREELWLLTYGGGVLRISAEGERHYSVEAGELPSSAVYSGEATYDETGRRRLWLATRGGLVLIDERGTRVFNRSHGLPSDAVRGLRVQRDPGGEDLLWVATEAGLARLRIRESAWQTVSLLGSSENGIFGVLVEPDGQGGERLWLGSAREGLHLITQEGRRHFDAKALELEQLAVRGIWRVSDGHGGYTRLMGVGGGELFRIDEALRFTRLETPWPKSRAEAVTAAVSRRGDAGTEWWIGLLQGGAWRLREGRWTRMLAAEPGSQWATLGLAIEPTGDEDAVWLASGGGLMRWRGERMESIGDLLPPLRNMPFRHVAVIDTPRGRQVWASSLREGVHRLALDPEQPPRLLDASGVPEPPDPTVYSVTADSRGRVYVCTNNGVQQLTPLPAGGYAERVFHRRDGLVHDECNSNGQQVDAHDRFWVGTLGGLSVYDPSAQFDAAAGVAGPLRLTQAMAEGASLAAPASGALSVPAGNRALRIEFALLGGQRESETQYRSRLQPYETDFVPWSTEHGRSFGKLPPGDYTLEIQARNFAGVEAEPLRLSLEVAPLWWQRGSIQLVGFLLGALLLSGLVLAYHRDLLRRQRQLERAVDSRTQALSEANAQLVELSYLDPLTALPNRRRLMDTLDRALDRARRKHSPLGLILIDVDQFKRHNDRHGHLAGDGALRAVAKVLGTVKRERDLVARYGGEEFVCLMEDAPLVAVAQVAERMRARVEALPPRELGNDQEGITLSAGILSRVPSAEDTPESLLRDADTALYVAKKMGRNQVVEHGG
ncbi:ligand-binding sensor domain-containing diguanylate cyclase [Pseudomarimonas salicorniae]|uniref:diguanylate cyclase n=1 Tax=Pseudomarimonas salicorniae TaxID=2933270 RepID=A0ABT0GER5_9GAMM|nr:diguanylate cyclase [Lysobacter sp. CAU 1642]MCK7593043.1 diguanylate cyclase [Lysobacter sp. CAU 1642]